MEYIDTYTPWGTLDRTGMEKEKVHREGLLHRSVMVWILNSKKELLLQRRSMEKAFAPGMLDVSFAGHRTSGESAIDAVLREGREELGIDVDVNRLTYLFTCPFTAYTPGSQYRENSLEDIYLYRADILPEDCVFTDREVTEVFYLSIPELEQMWKEKDPILVIGESCFALLFPLLQQILHG